MKTLRFEYGDLVFDKSGNLEMVSGKDELAQAVKMRILSDKGEWFQNEDFGLGYKEVTNKGKTKKDIEFAVREVVFQEERIVEVVFTRLEIDRANRSIDIRFKMRDDTGETLEVEVNV